MRPGDLLKLSDGARAPGAISEIDLVLCIESVTQQSDCALALIAVVYAPDRSTHGKLFISRLLHKVLLSCAPLK